MNEENNMNKDIDISNIDINSFPGLPNQKFAHKYTPIIQIESLLRKGLTHGQVAKILGITRPAVSRAVKRHGIDTKETELFIKDKADILASKQRLILNNVTPAQIKNMSVKDSVISFGILYDKERQERGADLTNESYFMQIRAEFNNNIGQVLVGVQIGKAKVEEG